jgi:hypothetical protein
VRGFGSAGAWLAGVVLVVGTAPTAASQIQPGRIYRGGEQISDPSLGLRLTMPAGWQGRLAPDGESFQMESDAGGGYMVVLADRVTEAEARQRMAEPVDLGGGVVLTPASAVQDVAAGHLTAGYTVRGAPAEYVGTVDVRLTQSGLSVAFVLLSPPAAAAEQRETMREFAFSLGVEQPVAPAGSGEEWEPYLRGLYLARYFTRTGYTESTQIWLCSDGTFSYDSQGGGFGGGASGAARAAGGGRWSATGAGERGTLVLDWSDGERTTFELRYDYGQNRVYLNGERMLRGKNERCR